jgi:hypothetical protein
MLTRGRNHDPQARTPLPQAGLGLDSKPVIIMIDRWADRGGFIMIGRWLPWIASAVGLGVLLSTLVSAPSGEMSPIAVPKTPVSVSDLIEPPPMTELPEGNAPPVRMTELPEGNSPPVRIEEPRPPPPIAVLPRRSAARHSLRGSVSRHVALHRYWMRGRICCVDPVIDKTGY